MDYNEAIKMAGRHPALFEAWHMSQDIKDLSQVYHVLKKIEAYERSS